jgi:hypothetical protein
MIAVEFRRRGRRARALFAFVHEAIARSRREPSTTTRRRPSSGRAQPAVCGNGAVRGGALLLQDRAESRGRLHEILFARDVAVPTGDVRLHSPRRFRCGGDRHRSQ